MTRDTTIASAKNIGFDQEAAERFADDTERLRATGRLGPTKSRPFAEIERYWNDHAYRAAYEADVQAGRDHRNALIDEGMRKAQDRRAAEKGDRP
ncbi:MAG: hypothetical protein CMN72_07875 [Sphingomonas sp.]|mgnify:CR=1 FL=1|nr:hypothetical protein [Sphingomonas sp.]